MSVFTPEGTFQMEELDASSRLFEDLVKNIVFDRSSMRIPDSERLKLLEMALEETGRIMRPLKDDPIKHDLRKIQLLQKLIQLQGITSAKSNIHGVALQEFLEHDNLRIRSAAQRAILQIPDLSGMDAVREKVEEVLLPGHIAPQEEKAESEAEEAEPLFFQLNIEAIESLPQLNEVACVLADELQVAVDQFREVRGVRSVLKEGFTADKHKKYWAEILGFIDEIKSLFNVMNVESQFPSTTLECSNGPEGQKIYYCLDKVIFAGEEVAISGVPMEGTRRERRSKIRKKFGRINEMGFSQYELEDRNHRRVTGISILRAGNFHDVVGLVVDYPDKKTSLIFRSDGFIGKYDDSAGEEKVTPTSDINEIRLFLINAQRKLAAFKNLTALVEQILGRAQRELPEIFESQGS